MEKLLSYEDKKLYFFHELTHALQTSHENGIEQCGFYNGHDGMFLTEGATQYIAEMLYNVSNGESMQHRQQPRTVRGASDRAPNSPLSEYQYNGDILELMAKSMDLPLPQILSLAYKKDGRKTLKEIYESMEGNQGKFDGLMNNLEQIYSIYKVLIAGRPQDIQLLQGNMLVQLTMSNGATFRGNLNTYRELMNKTERELVATYLENHNTQDILQNYGEIASLLTTPELQNNFLAAVHELSDLSQENRSNNIVNFEDYRRNREQETQVSQMQQMEMPEGYSINEFGEIIRPAIDERQKQEETKPLPLKTIPQYSENKLSIKQKIAKFLQKNNLFMNMSFVKKIVHQQLELLPEPKQDIREAAIDSNKATGETMNKSRKDFINQLTNFGAYRNLPPIQRMSDSQKLEKMKKKMEQHSKESDDLKR